MEERKPIAKRKYGKHQYLKVVTEFAPPASDLIREMSGKMQIPCSNFVKIAALKYMEEHKGEGFPSLM